MPSTVASPARATTAASASSPGDSLQATWDALCADLKYPHELRANGLDLLERMNSKQDRLGESTSQVRARPAHTDTEELDVHRSFLSLVFFVRLEILHLLGLELLP